MAQIYAYENLPHRRVTIHLGGCRECNYGRGKRGTGPTTNGSWTGPYTTLRQATTGATALQPLVRQCKICFNRNS
jgi:hypothetical protein